MTNNMSEKYKEYKGNPFNVMEMEAEHGRMESLLPSKHYKIHIDTDSYLYGASEMEDIRLSLTKLTIEAGSIMEENSISILPKLLQFMEVSFPNLYLKNIELRNQKLVLGYDACVMDPYYSLDELISNELKVAHQPLQYLITENSLTDVKLTVQIETN